MDTTYAETIGEAIVENLDENGGYDDDQSVAGLVQGIIIIAKRQKGIINQEHLLDEASALLADGGV